MSSGNSDRANPKPAGLTGKKAGPYLMHEPIGHGGMGQVYRASREDGAFEQQVAIKVLHHPNPSPEVVARFERERCLLAMLDHPNIARILDGGALPDGSPYYAMEYVPGESITTHCYSGKLNLKQRIHLFLEVCAAVAHAHQHLIIHRDLKPANVLVSATGGVKLVDFGIAKLYDAASGDPQLSITQLASPGARILTPSYAAPEQAKGEPVTTATDVYALGLLLFELLTGRRAQSLTETSPKEIESQINQTRPPKMSHSVTIDGIHPPALLAGDLESIIEKAIEKDPPNRYNAVSQLMADLERYLGGYPVLARKQTRNYIFRTYLKRNRTLVLTATLTAFTMTALTTYAVRQAQLAQQRSDAVRGLAKSLIDEINPALTDLPGSTKARHILVKRSVEYLDQITATAGNDVGLLRESAEAYEQIATIQGNRNKSNLGDYAGAMSSFRKALAIRERIDKIAPNLENKTWISLISAEASRVYPNTDEALALARRAVEIARSVRDDSNRKIAHVYPNSLFGLGYILTMREQAEEALPVFEEARSIYVAIKRRANSLSVCDRYTAMNLMHLGRTFEAQHYYRRAQATDEAFLAENPSPRASMDYSYDLQGIADSLAATGKWEEALTFIEKTHNLRRQLAAADPSDRRGQAGLSDSGEILAVIHAGLGHRTQAAAAIGEALTRRQQIAMQSKESPEDQYELARTYIRAGKIGRLLGDCSEAAQWFAKARPILEPQQRKLTLAQLEQEKAAAQACTAESFSTPQSSKR